MSAAGLAVFAVEVFAVEVFAVEGLLLVLAAALDAVFAGVAEEDAFEDLAAPEDLAVFALSVEFSAESDCFLEEGMGQVTRGGYKPLLYGKRQGAGAGAASLMKDLCRRQPSKNVSS